MQTIISMLFYIIIYIITIFICRIFVYKNKRVNSYMWMILVALIPSFISGIRYETGTDYRSYMDNFQLIVLGYNSRLEIAFQYLNKISYYLGFGGQFMLFLSALIMMIFICFSINRKRKNISVCIGLFVFLFVFYQSSFNVVRIMLAIAVSFYNIKNVEQKKLIKFTLITILAGSFHSTAFIMFPIYFVYNYFIYQDGKFKKLLLYFVTAAILINFNIIIQNIIGSSNQVFDLQYYSKYSTDSDGLSYEALRQLVFYLPMTIVGIFEYKKCKKIDEKFYIYYSLTFIGTIVLLISIFLENYVYRMADYFLIYNVFVIPIYYKSFKFNSRNLRAISLLCFVVFYWVFWYFINGAHGTYHYSWILS